MAIRPAMTRGGSAACRVPPPYRNKNKGALPLWKRTLDSNPAQEGFQAASDFTLSVTTVTRSVSGWATSPASLTIASL